MGGSSADRVTASEADSLGGASGEETHQITIDEMPSHTHSFKKRTNTGSDSAVSAGTGDSYTWTTGYIQSVGGDEAHNNMPPYLTLNYIIKA